jgi:hypothetical protein
MAKAKSTAQGKDPMAKIEKMNDGTMSGLKKTIIGTVGTIVTAGGAFLMTYLQKPKEGENKQAAPQSININMPAQQAASNKTIIVQGSPSPAQKDLHKAEKSEAPKTKKKEGEEFKEEAPKW